MATGASTSGATGDETMEITPISKTVIKDSVLSNALKRKKDKNEDDKEDQQPGDRNKKQTPEEIKKSVYTMVKNLGKFYNQMMVKAALNDINERTLIQNSHAVERVLLASTDDKKTEYQKKKAAKDLKDGKPISDTTLTGAIFYKAHKDEKGAILYEPVKKTFDKDMVKALYVSTMEGNGFSGLNHIMIGHSQMNDVCFQRSKAMKQVGLDTSLISTFSGSTLPRRSGATGTAVKGGGTLVADAIRFIKRAMADRSLMRDFKAKAAYEKILLNLKGKCSAPAQKALVEQVLASRNPGAADIEDLVLLARSFIVVRPSVASKVTLPLSIYALIETAMPGVDQYSMVGYEAMNLYNQSLPISILRNGETAEDKSQMFFMSCFGGAYEDLRVLSVLTGHVHKPRSQLKSKGFHVPVKEQVSRMTAAVMGTKLQFWAPMTRSGGNEQGGEGGSGQIGCSPAFSVERPIAISRAGVRKLMSANVEGRDIDIKGSLLKMMSDAMGKKTLGNAFTGKCVYRMDDSNKAASLVPILKDTIPSFFFGRDTSEDFDDVAV